MSELPEDLNRWPSDPFEMLNLSRSDDARTAKRSYFKLVRKYKPDRFPAEFQKIREAYESVESWLRWQDHRAEDEDEFSGASDETGQVVGALSGIEADEMSSDSAESLSSFSSTLLKADPVEAFFDMLNSKGLNAAIMHLRNAGPSNGAQQVAKTSLIKYFVARFFPTSLTSSPSESASDQVDLGYSTADQQRIAWLLKALDSSDTSSAAMAQLRVEFDQNYRLANCESVNDYLSNVTDYRPLANFYQLRWEAIGHYHPLIVVNDLKKIQVHSLEFGGYRGEWMSLLSESMNYTLWHGDSQCVEHSRACWQEISENDQSWTADSVELLLLASDEWKEMFGGANSWTAAIPWARNTLPETSRAMWMPVAQEISADPIAALKTLDYHFLLHSMAMTVFEEGLQNLVRIDSEVVDDLPWEETRELVACCLTEFGSADYSENRIPMMEFCILNQVSPMTFAAAANSFVRFEGDNSWLDLVRRDGPLKCVVNACHVTNW